MLSGNQHAHKIQRILRIPEDRGQKAEHAVFFARPLTSRGPRPESSPILIRGDEDKESVTPRNETAVAHQLAQTSFEELRSEDKTAILDSSKEAENALPRKKSYRKFLQRQARSGKRSSRTKPRPLDHTSSYPHLVEREKRAERFQELKRRVFNDSGSEPKSFSRAKTQLESSAASQQQRYCY